MPWRLPRGVVLAVALVLALVCSSWTSQVHAQANYEGVQVGGRTAIMGGTAVANGADQASVFVNPAVTTRIPEKSFAFSTFMTQIRGRTIDSSLDPSGRLSLTDPDVNQLKLRIQPNTFCIFLDGPPKDEYSGRSRHKYSVCAAATEREEMDFTKNEAEANSSGDAILGVAHSTSLRFVRSTVAMSWGYELDRNTSIGVTSRIDNARLNDQTTATAFAVVGDDAAQQSLDHSIDANSWDTSLVIGMTKTLSRVVTLGVALTTPSQHLFGKYTAMSVTSVTQGIPFSTVQDNGDFRYHHPGSLRLGFAFTWPRLILGVDGSFYGPQRQLARANFDRRIITIDPQTGIGTTEGVKGEVLRGSVAERGRPVTNLSLGLEYFLRRDYSLVAGAQTDFSGIAPRQDSAPTDTLFRSQKNAIHGALGITTYGDSGRLLLGIRGHYATGSILIADAGLQTPTFIALPQREWGLNLVVSGSLTFRAVKAAAEKAIPLNQAKKGRAEEEPAPEPKKEKDALDAEENYEEELPEVHEDEDTEEGEQEGTLGEEDEDAQEGDDQ